MAAEEQRKTTVTILTDVYRIKGDLHLMPGARLTDYMVEAKGFIAITDAQVWEAAGRPVFAAPFLNVNRDSIRVIVPN
ncbi:MAG: hypothetical protein Q7R45_08155 [Sulfuricaulis sp.]|nr:hypothetical protein [Sulfuricaulis sp.]